MATDNAFDELGLSPDATEIEVKAAWRRLVSQWHPDRNDSSGAVAKMQRINQAFKTIAQAGFRANAEPSNAADPMPARPGAHAADRPGSADDPFDDIRKAQTPPFSDDTNAGQQRRTIWRRVRLTLEEAAAGCTKVLRGKVTDDCTTCVGVGYQMFAGACAQCEGSGTVRQRAWFGWLGTLAQCEDCQGSGDANQECLDCAGTGKLAPHRYRVAVRIPHGVRNGDLLHVDAQHPRPGQVPGDLEIRVDVRAHDFFTLDDDGTIRCELPVDGFMWMANREVEVPTVTGLQRLQLRRDQRSYRLPGQGFPVARRGPRGDHQIDIFPVFPQPLSTDQEILLDQLIATSSGPDGQASDPRLRAWEQRLHTWEQGLPQRGR